MGCRATPRHFGAPRVDFEHQQPARHDHVGRLPDQAINHRHPIRTAEIERLSGRMADFTEEQRETVETITRGIVAKLLHNPSVSLREAAGSAQGERLSAAVRDLFNLH